MPGAAATKFGHGFAKVFGIKLQYRDQDKKDPVNRGESVFSVASADTYVESEPTTMDFIHEVVPSKQTMINYGKGLFPFVHWAPFYNLQWFYGDLVAGVTIGAVVVPQSMAYAKLALLPVEFGLYSGFMGVLIYWIFATSKDITIGPVAVMSTITGNVVAYAKIHTPQYQGYQVAQALAVICGAIVCFLGLIRIGWVVEFISLTSILAFITGSAINILCGQVPTLMGINSHMNTRAPTYLVIINTFKNLHYTTLDAALGLTALVMLYLIRFVCNTCAKRFPKKAKMFFFLATLRTAFVICLYTLISYLVNRDVAANHNANSYKKAHTAILGPVPRGFQHAGVPIVNKTIIKGFASQIPVSVIVLLIEHIAISKSFGRINNYTIDPSQELLAIGVTNLLGPFLGAYPATGSFSRTAIKAKAGVRTPFAGVITAIIVLIAIYALPAAFYWISNASLSAVIIHAVGDLIADPNTVYQFWRVSPLEVIIFFIGVIVTVFSSIEDGIYTTLVVSVVVLLVRVAKARGRFLGKVKIHSVVGDHLTEDESTGKGGYELRTKSKESNTTHERDIFLPIDHHDGTNPDIDISAPYPGVYVYRFSEGFNYPNANHYLDQLTATIFSQTRKTNPNAYARLGDRPWNNPGPTRSGVIEVDYSKPTLKALILDFSSVNNVDITSVQQLIDVRNQLDRYTAPDRVEWHFACINNRWTKRALVAAGFGLPTPSEDIGDYHRWKPLYSVAELGGSDSAAAAEEAQFNKRSRSAVPDIEAADRFHDEDGGSSSSSNVNGQENDLQRERTRAARKVMVVGGLNRPFFHLDVTSAFNSAVASIKGREDAALAPEVVDSKKEDFVVS